MSSGLTILRIPYEEPYTLHLLVRAFDEHQSAEQEIYCNADDLTYLANELHAFPPVRLGKVVEWELGSEEPEDRCAFYFRLGFRQISARGECLVEVRFNNNQAPPKRRVAEFSFPVVASDLDRLTKKLQRFGCLRAELLEWKVERAWR